MIAAILAGRVKHAADLAGKKALAALKAVLMEFNPGPWDMAVPVRPHIWIVFIPQRRSSLEQ